MNIPTVTKYLVFYRIPFVLVTVMFIGIYKCVQYFIFPNAVEPNTEATNDTRVTTISIHAPSPSQDSSRASNVSNDLHVLSLNIKSYQLSEKVKCFNHIAMNNNQGSMTCAVCFHQLNVDFFDTRYLKQICNESITDEGEDNSDDKYSLIDFAVDTGEMCVTECGHTFHFMCLKRWMEENQTCSSFEIPTNLASCRLIYRSISEETPVYYMRQVENLRRVHTIYY